MRHKQAGMVLPMALSFIVILGILGTGLMVVALQNLTNSVQFSYNQIAHVASKAAIDYAEEQYELDPDYDGTPEQELVANDFYRSTIEVEILYNQTSSSKRIRAYGRVYVPELAADAEYVREIQSTIIRNGIVAGNPADYEPLIWLASDEENSLLKPSQGGTVETAVGQYGSSAQDIVEEGGSDGGFGYLDGVLEYGGDDLDLGDNGFWWGHQSAGLRFHDIDIDQGTTINEAYVQFTADETRRAGSVQYRVSGVASDDASGWGSSDYAVTNAPKTTASVVWEPPDWNGVGDSGVDERVDVTSILQEIINRSGWQADNEIAITIEHIQGSGVRTATKGQSGDPVPQLIVEYGNSSGGGFAENTGDAIGEWKDRTLNGYDAETEYGSDPTFVDNAINGKPAVRFGGGSIMRSFIGADIWRDYMTVFAVMAPNDSNTDVNGRFVSAMNTSASQDYNNSQSAIPLLRDGNTQGMMNYVDNDQGESLSGVLDGSWQVISSRVADNYVERLWTNTSGDNYSNAIYDATHNIDEFFFGGARDGTAGTSYSQMDVAEIIIYDSFLSCTEMSEVESYLGLKYGIGVSNKGC